MSSSSRADLGQHADEVEDGESPDRERDRALGRRRATPNARTARRMRVHEHADRRERDQQRDRKVDEETGRRPPCRNAEAPMPRAAEAPSSANTMRRDARRQPRDARVAGARSRLELVVEGPCDADAKDDDGELDPAQRAVSAASSAQWRSVRARGAKSERASSDQDTASRSTEQCRYACRFRKTV